MFENRLGTNDKRFDGNIGMGVNPNDTYRLLVEGDLAVTGSVIQLTGGNSWYVDTVNGNDANSGTASSPFKTFAKANTSASALDTIWVRGSLNEAATITAKDGLKILGWGTTPHAAKWTSATDTNTLTISSSNGVMVAGIDFAPPPYTAQRNIASIVLSNAPYTRIVGNRFQGQVGSQNAIYSPVCNSDNVVISGNEFLYMNTVTYGTAILGVSTGGLAYSDWRIMGNTFDSCVIAIKFNAKCAVITDNIIKEYGLESAVAGGAIAAVLALGISLVSTFGGGGGANYVTRNLLGGAYTATLYKVNGDVAGSDNWLGNTCVAGTGAATSFSTLNPA